jgi:hypothetical protein
MKIFIILEIDHATYKAKLITAYPEIKNNNGE